MDGLTDIERVVVTKALTQIEEKILIVMKALEGAQAEMESAVATERARCASLVKAGDYSWMG